VLLAPFALTLSAPFAEALLAQLLVPLQPPAYRRLINVEQAGDLSVGVLARLERGVDLGLEPVQASQLVLQAEHIALAEKQKLLAIERDRDPAVLREIHNLIGFDARGDEIAALGACAGTDRENRAALRLALSELRDDEPGDVLLALHDGSDEDAVVQWSEAHVPPLIQ
jgi:hypothetical protein